MKTKKVIKMSVGATHRLIMLIVITGAWLAAEKMGCSGWYSLILLALFPAQFSIPKTFGSCHICKRKTLLEISTWDSLLILYFFHKSRQEAPQWAETKKVKRCIPCKRKIA